MIIKRNYISLQELLKKGIRRIRRIITEIFSDYKSDYFFCRFSKKSKKKNWPIRVGYIVQMPEIWDKEEPVYRAMQGNPMFCADIIVVPEYDFVNKVICTNYKNTYFFEKYPDAIKAKTTNGWLNITQNDYDYVFYQRPYNQYLPRELNSNKIVTKSKICYIPYAFWPLKEYLCGYNKDFFRNIYFSFLESPENADIIKRWARPNRKVIFCGYPALDSQIETYSLTKKVLWTPRWSYDSKIGGSHFFEYKEQLLSLFSLFSDWQLVVRPHPLAFENYISEGLMSSEEKDLYIKKLSMINGKLDTNNLIEDTFRETSILISDISSIIFSFFITENPIIYCTSGIEESPAFITLKRGMYIAKTWDEVEYYVHEIINGNDPLKDVRKEINSQIKEKNKNAANNIIQYIIDDYYEHTLM